MAGVCYKANISMSHIYKTRFSKVKNDDKKTTDSNKTLQLQTRWKKKGEVQ
jgi:hypothetical protein